MAGNNESDMTNDDKLAMLQELAPESDFDTLRAILEQSDWDLNQASVLVLGGDFGGGGVEIVHDNDLQRALDISRGVHRTVHGTEGGNIRVNVNAAGGSRSPPPPTLDEISDDNPWSKLLETNAMDEERSNSPLPESSNTRHSSSSPEPLEASGRGTSHLKRRPLRKFTDNRGERNLAFTIEYTGRAVPFSIQESETVGELRKKAYMTFKGRGDPAKDMNDSAPEDFKLYGWHTNFPEEGDICPDDPIVLADLSLAKQNDLYVVWDGKATENDEPFNSEPFRLSINDNATGRKHEVFVRINETFSDVKKTVHGLTNIPPSKQLWIGLPPDVTENKIMVECGFQRPIHELSVERNPVSDPSSHLAASSSVDILDSPSSSSPRGRDSGAAVITVSDDDMDIDFAGSVHDTDLAESAQNGRSTDLPLIPEGVGDAAEGVESFTRVFESRYGPIHPHFYHGSLDEAVRECFGGLPGEKRLMALYLHHDGSVASNIFCSQILCSQQVSSFLNANFVVWPWDLTLRENKDAFIAWANTVFGGNLPISLFHMPPSNFPSLIVLTQDKSSFQMLARAGGTMSLDEVMLLLMQALEEHSLILAKEREEEAERQNREIFRMEQQQAYAESLAADKAKEQEKNKLEAEKAAERERERKLEEELKNKRENLAAALPPEPAEDSAEPTATIRMRLPDGEMISRRFLAKDPLKVFLMFVGSRGLDSDKYRFLTSYPKRDLSAMDHNSTLEELKLYPREQITVEER